MTVDAQIPADAQAPRGNRFGSVWTREACLSIGRRWLSEYGTSPTRWEFDGWQRRHRMATARERFRAMEARVAQADRWILPSLDTIRRLFADEPGEGSPWAKYLRACGMTPRPTGRTRNDYDPRPQAQAPKVRRRERVPDELAGIPTGREALAGAIRGVATAQRHGGRDALREALEYLELIAVKWRHELEG